MANKHVKRGSVLSGIRELQIKNTMRSSSIPIRLATIKKADNAKNGEEAELQFSRTAVRRIKQ